METTTSTAPFGNALVLGLGKTGADVARYLVGRSASVTLYGGLASKEGPLVEELRELGINVVLGTEDIEGAYDLAVVSPGISENSAFFANARSHATEVMGEPEFAWRQSPKNWVAITGTNGKTTTTALTTELLRAAGMDAEAVGNIGTLITGALEGRRAGQWFVAELSSYQLATTSQLHPRAACLLNVTPDHLSWHGSMEAYALAKEKVFANFGPEDLAVVSCEDEWCRAAIKRLEARGLSVCHLSTSADPLTTNAAFARDGMLVVRLAGVEHELVGIDELFIKGEHNVQNSLAAASLALFVGADIEGVRAGLRAFKPLEHRIEPCGSIAGVSFVNDSKATNTDSVEKALTAFVPGSVVLLLGGKDKGTDLTSLMQAAATTCHAVVCFGAAGERMEEAAHACLDAAGVTVARAGHLEDALDAGIALARPGDVVLLSPACASFDEFSSFEERGRVFKDLVAARIAAAGEGC
ncbi:MAG: UDP-N-acetylmuramoyl-L-alanine--D-glutamate ligase [Atopobiaceae bacterium]|nr:UDP-N-acetylmuramoyl-L-alanine--D-glutamate ligase [Atopobiaceae bacterium]